MKRASYRHAVQWIASEDEPTSRDVESISQYISTLLIADIFAVELDKVANDVLKYRQTHEEKECPKQSL